MNPKSVVFLTFGAHFLSVSLLFPPCLVHCSRAVWPESEIIFFIKNIAVFFDGRKKLYKLAANYNPFYN